LDFDHLWVYYDFIDVLLFNVFEQWSFLIVKSVGTAQFISLFSQREEPLAKNAFVEHWVKVSEDLVVEI